MQTSIPIGFYHPSIGFPNHIDLSNISFLVGTDDTPGNCLREKYPGRPITVRTYLYNGKDPVSLYQKRFSKAKERANTRQINVSEQFVFNELLGIDGNPRRHLSYSQIMSFISETYNLYPHSEIIINEMNPYHIPKYTGNGIQKNGVIPFLLQIKKTFPKANISLGIQTIGNALCKDVLLKSLDVVLEYIRKDHPLLPIHFTEIGYYHLADHQQEQTLFLDKIIEKANKHNIASLCFMYPWDGDNFHLPGQPRNTYCGIWDKDWQIKYLIERNVAN